MENLSLSDLLSLIELMNTQFKMFKQQYDYESSSENFQAPWLDKMQRCESIRINAMLRVKTILKGLGEEMEIKTADLYPGG